MSSRALRLVLASLTVSVLPVLSSQGASAATLVVTQKDHAFIPKQITVAVGDTIVFRNEDVVPHHVVSHTPQFTFDLDLEKPGEERQQVFSKAGQVIVGCDLHQQMEVIVDVVEAASK